MTLRRCLLSLLLAAAFAETAAAQSSTIRIAGTVTALDGRNLTVAAREGGTAMIVLAENWSVLEISRLDPAGIPPGAFVGAGAAPMPDGTLRAVQIVVFPDSMRGTGEGHRSWNVVPEGTMTNAPVAATVVGSSGPKLTLSTGGKSYDVTVPPEARVILMEPAQRQAIKPGASVVVNATPAADGTLTASRIQTGKDGAPPPL